MSYNVTSIKIDEWNIINEILKEYNGIYYDGEIDPLIEVQSALIKTQNILHGLNSHNFQICKNMLISLSKCTNDGNNVILSPDEINQFPQLNIAFNNSEFIECLNKIKYLCNKELFICGAIIRIRRCFSGECIMIAAHKKNNELFDKVSKLCYKYR